MIQNTFIFLEKIGKGLENSLWQQGIKNWDDFLKARKIGGLSNARKLYYDRQILKARNALYNFNSGYFQRIMPKSEFWRLYDFFKEDSVFLDIETTGLSFEDDITVFGLFNGIETKTMIKNINLDYKILKKELEKYKLIVTFNGSSFDIPFINKRYPGLLPNIPNFDIKSVTNRLGLKGGLKEIEKKLGIKRNKIIEKFYGGDALTLWRMYKATGDDYYLDLLVEYNEEDIINLKAIADYCVVNLKNKYLSTSYTFK
ncbi:ribonuclease H-like domain-containing protein [Candidatus Woesearchaeota archaeon]|nr:ribonuclease H-like domain-containing protein [Candidatus Woesearchaeota archaeon]